MGNAQSSPHDEQHPNKLSKPKTYANSPTLVPKNDSPLSKSAPLSTQERQQIRSQLLSPLEFEFEPSDSPTGSGELEILTPTVQRRLSGASRTNSLSCFASVRGSATKLTSLPGSKVSLASNSQAMDMETAVKLLQEIKKNASPEDLAALHEALQPSPPSPRSATFQPPGLARRKSVLNRSTSSLIRRRSLIATPGVATRHSPKERNRRTWNSWRTPQLDPQEEAKWRLEMMGTSPLTRLAGLDRAKNGRDSPTPRAQTPGEMDYSHLGSLKLGSLRIANGAPSPAADTRLANYNLTSNSPCEEDYFTPTEPCDSPIMMKPTKERRHARSKSAVQPPPPPLHRRFRISNSMKKAKTTSRCDSPLKAESLNPEKPASPSHEGVEPEDAEPEPVRRLRVMNKSADALAKDYQAELPRSPFETTTHGLPDHDEGFVFEDAAFFRETASRILDGTIFVEPIVGMKPLTPKSRSESEMGWSTARPKQQKIDVTRPPPKKVDSGYSSGGSFGAMQRGSSPESTTSELSTKLSIAAETLESGTAVNEDGAASLYTFEQMLRPHSAKKAQPPVPTSDTVVPRPASLHVPSNGDLNSVHQHSPEPKSRIQDMSFDFDLPKTPGSIVSHLSTDSKTSTQKRLQKRRPSHQELPVVQSCEPIHEGAIPTIPVDVRTKFIRRMSATPGMECLERTYLSKDHVNDEESSMINYSGPAIIKFPSPSTSPEPRGRHHSRSATERPSSPSRLGGLKRSLSLFRSKSKSGRKEKDRGREELNDSPIMVDFGTIATSLGESPYDAAAVHTTRKLVTSPTHPHQLGNALPRVQTMASMDARTAAAFARTRSKDRAQLRPEMPQRPKSYHDSNVNVGRGVAPRRRPNSFYAEGPPVPVTASDRAPAHQVQPPVDSVEMSSGPSFRTRSTRRGPVVSELIVRYDQDNGPAADEPSQDWDAHARLWSQRRKSIGEGLRERAAEDRARSNAIHESAMPRPVNNLPVVDRYSGGLDYNYEGSGYGIAGSAGTRQLHSYASRKSMHFSNQYGVDLSDVPVFLQRV